VGSTSRGVCAKGKKSADDSHLTPASKKPDSGQVAGREKRTFACEEGKRETQGPRERVEKALTGPLGHG